ncbi:MAG: PKD domain-containing protein [Ferruginibacter sp.]|nr:PKD domain-containing protein [Ferruginibacter sp.]
MITNIKNLIVVLLATLLGLGSCKKEQYSFGNLVTPSNLVLTADVAGLNAANPNGNGTGMVAITTAASNAITYKIDFGDGTSKIESSGTLNYKYKNPGTFDYTVTVNAIGTGGTTSTISKKIKVYVAFVIPISIVEALTNNSSRIWITDKGAPGHVGVGPSDAFSPIWYAAPPNGRDACLYDDEITFSKDAGNNIFMSLDNKGQSSLIGASTASYGLSGGDGCYNVGAGTLQKLVFMDASSASTTANSTRIQFDVPGNGIVNFATGGKTYEILSISATNIHLRNIGIDGNSWYQKLKAK